MAGAVEKYAAARSGRRREWPHLVRRPGRRLPRLARLGERKIRKVRSREGNRTAQLHRRARWSGLVRRKRRRIHRALRSKNRKSNEVSDARQSGARSAHADSGGRRNDLVHGAGWLV